MSFDDKRKLLMTVFSGKDAEGKRLGVYVRKVNDTFHFTINGGFGNISGKLPMSKTEAQRILDIGTDYNRLAKKSEGQEELTLVGNFPGLLYSKVEA
jgi:hypothetical protein